MSETALATTSTPMSASSSVFPSTSANVSPAPSVSSLAATTLSSNGPSATSAPKSSVQPMTSSVVSASITAQLPTLLSSFATSKISTTTTTAPISTPHSASSVPSTTTTPLSSPSASLSQSSPARTDVPLTTVLENTTVFITSTNSQGQVVTSVPPVVTEVITTTGSGGIATTVTQAIVNPTLASNNNIAGGSSFFSNTGAVVGIFVVVGLASAAIMMWMLCAIRRRQRMRRIEQDTAIEAAVTAAGFNRAPLDDGDEADSPISPTSHRQFLLRMDQPINFLAFGDSGPPLISTRRSVPDADDPVMGNPQSSQGHPVVTRTRGHSEEYVLTRTAGPPLRAGFTDELGSSRDRKSSYGHTPTYSAGSFEPLLANYVQNVPDQDAPAVEPPRNRSRLNNHSGPNEYSSDGSPGSRTSLRGQYSSNSSVLQEEDDYAYVLTVRNVPDDQSQRSA